MTILIVDDKPENLYLLESLLKGVGYKTVIAKNGAEALGLAKKDKPDLIISDILMPVMDGYSLCRECKKDEQLKNVPFIFYTATYTDPKDEEFALSLGGDQFLLKPQEPDVFLDIIENCLKKKNEYKITRDVDPLVMETVILKEYNQTLIRKLEDKMRQTEENEKKLKKYVKELEDSLSERLKIEKALIESEELYRLVQESSMDAILLSKPNGEVLSANKAACEMFGMSEEEICALGRNGLVDLSDPRLPVLLDERKRNGKARGELTFIRKDKSKFPAEVSSSLFVDSSGIYKTSMIIRDVTERKESLKKLTLLAHAIKSVSECISITDEKDNIIFVNESFLQTYGYTEDELIGKHINILRRNKTAETEYFKNIYLKTIEGGWKGEVINVKKNGTEFPVHLSTSVIKDDNNHPIALIGVATDITERKRAREELIRAKEKAELSDRLKSEFLAQMSHEIRSPLNVVISMSNLIKDEFYEKLDSDQRQYFEGIELAGKRIIRTIDLILNASEIQIGTYQPYFVEIDLMKDVFAQIQKEYIFTAKRKGLELNIASKTQHPCIMGDHYSVSQIFVNLVDNAIKYTNEGCINIVIDSDKEKHICVTVEDTGIGISQEYLNTIFEPFTQEDHGYTRKFEGNGLGLGVVKKFCELNEADIKVESEKSVGSKFTVTFMGSHS